MEQKKRNLNIAKRVKRQYAKKTEENSDREWLGRENPGMNIYSQPNDAPEEKA